MTEVPVSTYDVMNFDYDSLEVRDTLTLSTELKVVHIDQPVSSVWEGNIGEGCFGKTCVNSTKNKKTAFLTSSAGKVESEALILNLTLIVEYIEDGFLITNGDGLESHTQDTVHLCSGETDSLEGLNESQVDALSN